MAFSENQLERYSRHFVLREIGVSGQKKLLSSKVLVIGAGALGSSALMYLASAGVGTIGEDIIIFDNGTYTESCDNWYSEKKTPKETLKDALDYLCSYWKNCNLDPSSWMITICLAQKMY